MSSTGATTRLELPRSPAPPRVPLLRVTVFVTALGGALTIVYALILAREDVGGGGSPLLLYHQLLVPLLALVAIVAVLQLHRFPLPALALLLGCGVFSFAGGGAPLLPGLVLASLWASLRSSACRRLLGFLLLMPGTAGGYYALMAALSYATRQSLPGLPASLNPPLHLGDVLYPAELLPLALLGAWLLLERDAR